MRSRLWLWLGIAGTIAVSSAAVAGIDVADLRLFPLLDLPADGPSLVSTSSGLAWLAVALATGAGAGGLVARGVMAKSRRHLRASLAKSRMRYDHLAEQTSDVVLRFARGEATISSSIEALTGYSTDDMRTLPMGEIVHPDDLARVRAAFVALDRTHARNDLTYRLIHRSGSVVWVEATFGRMSVSDIEQEVIVTIRDITARQEEAEALRVATQAARDATRVADLANRAKSDFLASMSHEVRTPLNAIIGFAELLITRSDLPHAARRQAERIRGGGDALLSIVNDILDFAQAEAGTLRLSPLPFSLPLLVDECVALVGQAAADKRLQLRVVLKDEVPPHVLGDEARLRQILLNLLNNAIKFTHQGSVTLTIGLDPQDAGLLFDVTDTGIGIASDDLPRLFQRFSQVDGTIQRTFGGPGLGLAISKMLVELMGGRIGVTSRESVGSSFWFALDLAPTRLSVEAPYEPTRRTPRRALDLLLVEDTPINQALARAVLEADGHNVDVVGDGAECLMAVEDKAYDLILMDVQMPHVDGLTATRLIRSLPHQGRFVPIVAITANVLKSQTEAARAAGMDDVLAKPLDFAALRNVLDRTADATLRPDPRKGTLDDVALDKLVRVMGASKVEAMIGKLAQTLASRFTLEFDETSVRSLKSEAHASIGAAATLGFAAFAETCRRFVDLEDVAMLDREYEVLRAQLANVIATARTVAMGGLPAGDCLVA